ncbi:hypothetical protein CVT25_014450 [Psilocybe cyanescens]|uniref:Uncharacterized protein n=1 Tax=Psilocybe cyanescens TaxID=93625 RepID=A0A409XRJ7_PSICY|nr:hypothetical protein CVT25_014450 [Psilocybe cyanescens]
MTTTTLPVRITPHAPCLPTFVRAWGTTYQELPPIVVSEVSYETQTKTVVQTETVTVPPPANTRLAAFPSPEAGSPSTSAGSPRTTAVEVITDEKDNRKPRTVVRGPIRPPARWFGNW